MQFSIISKFSPDRKEPLADMLERIRGSFVAFGFGEPEIEFFFTDQGVADGVDRVLKRFPGLQRYLLSHDRGPDQPPDRCLSNGPGSPAVGETLELAILLAIAAGVPRSFPIRQLVMWFRAPALGAPVLHVTPGIRVEDSWWVNGRRRALNAVTVVDADPGSKRLTPPPAVAAFLASFGKAKVTQAPIGVVRRPVGQAMVVFEDFKARRDEIVDRAHLPHELPASEGGWMAGLADRAGQTPMLTQAFEPLGYDCHYDGSYGRNEYFLRRRTVDGLLVVVKLDLGHEGRALRASFGVSIRDRLNLFMGLPVSKRAAKDAEYSIRDEAQWQQIVGNLVALVAELDRSYVPAIEAATADPPSERAPA